MRQSLFFFFKQLHHFDKVERSLHGKHHSCCTTQSSNFISSKMQKHGFQQHGSFFPSLTGCKTIRKIITTVHFGTEDSLWFITMDSAFLSHINRHERPSFDTIYSKTLKRPPTTTEDYWWRITHGFMIINLWSTSLGEQHHANSFHTEGAA